MVISPENPTQIIIFARVAVLSPGPDRTKIPTDLCVDPSPSPLNNFRDFWISHFSFFDF